MSSYTCLTLFFILVTVAKADTHPPLRLHWQEIVSTAFWMTLSSLLECMRVVLHVGLVTQRIVPMLTNLWLMWIKQMKWGKKKDPVLHVAKRPQKKILISPEDHMGASKRG